MIMDDLKIRLYDERSSASYFFFFQAEDGIRDDLVTGVQTCALPIFEGDLAMQELRAWPALDPVVVPGPPSEDSRRSVLPFVAWVSVAAGARSEERRVGKECRSRWSPYH